MESQRKAELSQADLLVDRLYEGGRNGNASDDPLPHLIGVSNQGGFRYIGTKEVPRLVVLTSTLRDADWPDRIDKENGIFTYFGDNKKPGYELHDTPRFGNRLLRDMFERAHGSARDRSLVPPVLIFSNTGAWRDVEFLGLAVPGAEDLDSNQDLVAVWKLKDGKRFQNYQATFTILDTQTIPRKWLDSIREGRSSENDAPVSWKAWVDNRVYRPLRAPRAIEYRSKEEQLPDTEPAKKLITRIYDTFADDPYRFEACAAKIAELMLDRVAAIDLTRYSRDGGRDAVGKYRIGDGSSAVLVDFALEAKCYGINNSVGVKELSRLISRLRHRQFGVLGTTSYVAAQAYQEIKEDGHPIVIIAASDILRLLRAAGVVSEDQLISWLSPFTAK